MFNKKSTLSLAVAAAAGLAVSQANATAWDSNDYTGGDPNETHDVAVIVDGLCINFCPQNGATNLEADFIVNIPNANPVTLDASGNPVDPTVADRYACGATVAPFNENVVVDPTFGCIDGFDASGNPIADVAIPFYTGYFRQVGAVENPFSSPVVRWDISTDAEGRITDGWFLNEILFAGTNFTIFHSFTTGAYCTTSGDTADNFDVDAVEASGDCADAGGLHAIDGTSVSGFKYNTCDIKDSCGGGAKAVPVPAFAAAGLGLGLVGITLLTGRKKKVS